MSHFSMKNQKAMATNFSYAYGRRFASTEYWENVHDQIESDETDAEGDWADMMYNERG